MEQKKLYILLDIIFRNGSVKRLVREGVRYSDIANEIRRLIHEGMIEYSRERIDLTEAGVELMNRLQVVYRKTNKEEWIEKDEKSQIAQIEENFIFVPRQDELTF